MPRWDPQSYLAFADQRRRPFVDLVQRVSGAAATIVDLGCGPGQQTAVLRDRWPAAWILAVDSSAEMIAQATRDNTDHGARYQLGDIADWQPEQPVDLIISNAAFQWVPEQLRVISRLRGFIAPAGALAFQVPNNFDSPSYQLLHAISSWDPYAGYTAELHDNRGVDAADYLELLADPTWQLDVWQTTYLHVLPGADPVFGWISGTGARPILQALPDNLRERFITEYQAALRQAYPRHEYGTVLPFRRVFVVARRGADPVA